MDLNKKYDRQGREIDSLEWGKLFEDRTYQSVAKTDLPNGYRVSTVWLGLDHRLSWSAPAPLIFETMVFYGDGHSEEWCERYSTEDEARTGHQRAIDEFATKPPKHATDPA